MKKNQDPLFSYIGKERSSVLQDIYRVESDPKSYDRFPRIELPPARSCDMPLSSLLQERRSKRGSNKTESLSLNELSSLLRWGCGVQENSFKQGGRVHPSGGAKYPLELYPIVFNIEGLMEGAYHYHLATHTLEHLTPVHAGALKSSITSLEHFVEDSGVIFLFSFVKSRSMGKYGGLAYKLALLEAGHISQNLYLLSANFGIACCGLGLANAMELNEKLALDGVNESIIYGMVFGKSQVTPVNE